MKLYHEYDYKSRSAALFHARAEKKQHKLGSKWKIEISENMGWHWGFTNGKNIYVTAFEYKGKVRSYTCFLGESHAGTYCQKGRTPQEAVRNTLASAKDQLAWHQHLVNEASRVAE
jgi:hypothetical protein